VNEALSRNGQRMPGFALGFALEGGAAVAAQSVGEQLLGVIGWGILGAAAGAGASYVSAGNVSGTWMWRGAVVGAGVRGLVGLVDLARS
jgi:hypothetical protein